MSDEKTLRDTFAAAALTGLLVSMREESMDEVCESAYGWADAMIRIRGTAVSDNCVARRFIQQRRDRRPAAAAQATWSKEMTQQWQLSGNAETVDWSDIATAGRAYADNLVGEPAVSKVMHMMADEIERLRRDNASNRRNGSEFLRRPYCGPNCAGAKTDVIGPQSAAKTDTTQPRNGAPAEGSVHGESSVSDSRNANEPVAWGVMRVGGGCVSIVGNAVQAETSRQSFDKMENWVHEVVPLYRSPTLTDAEREAVEQAIDSVSGMEQAEPWTAGTLRGLLARLPETSTPPDARR